MDPNYSSMKKYLNGPKAKIHLFIEACLICGMHLNLYYYNQDEEEA